MNFLRWILEHFGENRYVIGKWKNRKWWNSGWIGSEGRIVFEDRPDPIFLSREERQNEMRRQIQEDIK